MTHPQVGLWILRPEQRADAPEGWLVLQTPPGPALTADGARVDLPAQRRLFPIEQLDHLDDQIRRIREVLQQEEKEAVRRAVALQRLAHRGVLYAVAHTGSPEVDAGMSDGGLSHLSVAAVAYDQADEERADALRAGAATPKPDKELLRRAINGVRRL
jgi:hypothetical protein